MSKELEKTYNPSEIEDRLYQKWLDNKYFHAEVDHSKKPFTIVIPPPNITGKLHMGHALDETLQDILIRFKKMQGYNTLWQPGTDHASIATEVKISEKRSLSSYMKKAIYTKGPGSSTGVRSARLQFLTQKLSMWTRQVISGISSIRLREPMII